MRAVEWPPPSDPSDAGAAAEGEAGGSEAARIVVADDDSDIRALLGAIVEREEGFELVGSAADTEEAIKVAREKRPDVVILDWMMPGGGGAVAASQISGAVPDARIIGITAGDAITAEYEMGTHGAVAFLQKGCAAAELVATIRSALRW